MLEEVTKYVKVIGGTGSIGGTGMTGYSIPVGMTGYSILVGMSSIGGTGSISVTGMGSIGGTGMTGMSNPCTGMTGIQSSQILQDHKNTISATGMVDEIVFRKRQYEGVIDIGIKHYKLN